MRCPNCGFPISPNNTSMTCPRCQTVLGSSPTPARAAQQQAEGRWARGTGAEGMLAADRQGQQNQWAFPPTSFTPPAQQTPQPTWAIGSQVQPPPQSQSWANGRFSPTL